MLTVGGGGPPEWIALSPPRPCHTDSTYKRRRKSFHYKRDSLAREKEAGLKVDESWLFWTSMA